MISLLSSLGTGSIILFFIKRYFHKKDEIEREKKNEQEQLSKKLEISLQTIKLLAYSRMSEEIERLLDKNFATPAERRILDNMYSNYKQHGWNGDMDARLKQVYRLPIKDAEIPEKRF